MDAEPHSTMRTRPSLLLRVQDWDDRSSWNEFHRLYRKFIYGLARRAGLAHADAEDVTQDVFACVAKTIAEFEANPQCGSFRRWLMNLTRWRINDRFRAQSRKEHHRRRQHDDTSTGTATIERIPDGAIETDAGWEKEWQEHLLDAACERVARRVDAKHFQIFQLYSRQHWPVLKVARDLKVNPATVYVINHRLLKQVKAEVAKLKAQLE
jgi:RNA polymerase sigma factor (sigma-70 family)